MRAVLLCGLLSVTGLSAEALDQQRIHAAYESGDFDRVLLELNGFVQRNPVHSREDSLFIAQHLAVVYAANPDTREKGRAYMLRVLEMVPAAKIMDLFVNEEIDRIFDKVKTEFLTRQRALGKTPVELAAPAYAPPAVPAPLPPPSAAPAPSPWPRAYPPAPPAPTPIAQASSAPRKPAVKKKDSKAVYWVAGGFGLAALGVTSFFLLQQPSNDQVYVVAK